MVSPKRVGPQALVVAMRSMSAERGRQAWGTRRGARCRNSARRISWNRSSSRLIAVLSQPRATFTPSSIILGHGGDAVAQAEVGARVVNHGGARIGAAPHIVLVEPGDMGEGGMGAEEAQVLEGRDRVATLGLAGVVALDG
jgi:hypothetical protein